MERLIEHTFEASRQPTALPIPNRGLNAVLRGTLTRAIFGRADANDLMDVVRLVESGRADSHSLSELAGQIQTPEMEVEPVFDDRVRQALLESLALINHGAMKEAARPLEAMIDTQDAWLLLGLIHDICTMKSLQGEERGDFEHYAAEVISHLLLEDKCDIRNLIRGFQLESIHLESPYNWLLNVIYRRTHQHILLDWLGRAYDILLAELEPDAQGEAQAYHDGLCKARNQLLQVEEVWYRWIGLERSELETTETQRGVVQAGYEDLLGLVQGCLDTARGLEKPPASPLDDFVHALLGAEKILHTLIRLMHQAQGDMLEGHLERAAVELHRALAYDPHNDLLAELILCVEGSQLPAMVSQPAEPEPMQLDLAQTPLQEPAANRVQKDKYGTRLMLPHTTNISTETPQPPPAPTPGKQIVAHFPFSIAALGWQTSRHMKGIKSTGWGLGWLVFFFLLFLAYGNLPNRWYHVLYVTSGSMTPAIQPGDLVIITPPRAPLNPGMILTLRVNGMLVTHRLLSIDHDGQLVTKGDANNNPDNWGNSPVEIGGIVRARIPYLGYLAGISKQIGMASTGSWFSDLQELKMEIGSGAWVIPTTTPHAQRGTSISADVTVNGICELDDDEDNDDGAAASILAGKRSDDEDHDEEGLLKVEGELCINNSGETATQDLRALVKMQFKPEEIERFDGGKSPENDMFQDLPDVFVELIPPEALDPGASRCYEYHMDFTPLADVVNYRVVAAVTISNHSGYLPGSHQCPGPDLCPFGPTPKASFSIPNTRDDDDDDITKCVLRVPLKPSNPTILETPLPPKKVISTLLTPQKSITSAITEQPSLPPQPTETPMVVVVTEEPTLPSQPTATPMLVITEEPTPTPQPTATPMLVVTEEPTLPPQPTETPVIVTEEPTLPPQPTATPVVTEESAPSTEQAEQPTVPTITPSAVPPKSP